MITACWNEESLGFWCLFIKILCAKGFFLFFFGEFLCILLFYLHEICFKVLALIIIRPEIQHEYDYERKNSQAPLRSKD